MIRAIISLAILAGVSSPAMAGDKEKLGDFPIHSLSTETEINADGFTVIYSRYEETGTAGAMFGLIGAAINSGINADEDNKRALEFGEGAESVDVKALVEAALLETLAGKDISVVEEDESHALNVDIKQWGLMKVSFEDDRVRTFIRVHLTMQDGKTRVWDVYQNETGRKAEFLDNYTHDLLQTELAALATKTGKRIAYEIIYR